MTVLQERIFIIIIACLLDLVFGDPHWLWHPVQGMGWLIDHVETWMRKRFRIREDRDADIRKKQVAGTFTVVIVITVSLLVAAGILYGCNRIHHTLYLVVAIWMSYQMLAACSLRRESMKVCSAGMAKQMIYTARNIKAADAYRIGLVNEVYSAEVDADGNVVKSAQEVMLAAAQKMAATIAKNAPIAVRNCKKAINEGLDADMDQAVAIEEKLFGDCFETEDQKYGMAFFLDKNKEKVKEPFQNK